MRLPNGVRWTEEEAATVRRMAADGHPGHVVAARLGRSPRSVYSWAYENDVSFGRRTKWSARERTRVVELYRAGMGCEEIGRTFGRTEKAVRAVVRKMGASDRARQGRRVIPYVGLRYALAREGFSASEVIAVLGLTIGARGLHRWIRVYCKRAGLPVPVWPRVPQFRAELVEAKRAALRLTGKGEGR